MFPKAGASVMNRTQSCLLFCPSPGKKVQDLSDRFNMPRDCGPLKERHHNKRLNHKPHERMGKAKGMVFFYDYLNTISLE